MHEKLMMTSIVVAAVADVTTSVMAFAKGLEEGGLLASHLMEVGDVDDAIMARMAVALLLMGVYALSKEYPSKYTDPIEKGVQLGNLYAWYIAVSNAIIISMR